MHTPVNVVLAVGWKVIVDDKRHLLYINTTSEQICGDEYTTGARPELTHDHVTLSLLHVSVLSTCTQINTSTIASYVTNDLYSKKLTIMYSLKQHPVLLYIQASII